MAFRFAFLVIVLCFPSIIHGSHDSPKHGSHDSPKHDKHDKHGKHDKHDKHEKPDKHEKFDKHDKHDKHDKRPKHSVGQAKQAVRSVIPGGPAVPPPSLGIPAGPEVPAGPGIAAVPPAVPAGAELPPKPIVVPPGLSEDYYAKTCPSFDRILQETITPKQASDPTTAAACLRVFFHDCFVQGCDASVLINPTRTGPNERDNPLNLDLPGDAFDIILRLKTALELSCPGVVSCSDILSAATRHLVKQVGGPFYKVVFGKKDGRVSLSSNVDHNLVDEKSSFENMFRPFNEKGFSARDMVVLLGGGHTIGFAHCSKFADRIYKFSPTQEIDPSLNPSFAQRLRQLCTNYTANPNMAAFMDPMSPGKFDNNFFTNVLKGLDLLQSDHILLGDPRTKPMVEEYSKDQDKFFKDFSLAMERLNVLDVKTGKDGEIRTNCFAINA